MMIRLFLLIKLSLLLVLSSVIYAKTYTETPTLRFNTTPVHAKYPKYFSGTLPNLEGRAFKQLNREIRARLYQDLDQEVFYAEIESSKIYQDADFLSFETFLQLSDLTSRYKSYYYTIDIKNRKLISLEDYLQRMKLSKEPINLALKHYIAQCRSENAPEACEDFPLQEMLFKIDDDEFFNLAHVSTFYLKAGILGLSFEDSKFSYDFEYHLKTQKIHAIEPINTM